MKKFSLKKKTALLVAGVLCAGTILSGCDNGKEVETSGKIIYPKDGVYPVECEDTITLWRNLHSGLTTEISNFGETELAKELEKQTGIKVEYIHPASGMADEQFNLLVASDDIPDIVAYNWRDYDAQTAIDEEIILPLNDVIDKWAPNFKNVLEQDAELAKMMQSADGNYYGFGFIRGDESLCTYNGPIIRKDWLDELGLAVPETIDEWEEMLVAFKEKKGATAPFSLVNSGAFSKGGIIVGAFGILDDYYLEDGKVKYGALEKGYKDFITLMKKWCDMGLVDKNLAGSDRKILTNNVLNAKTGATYLEAGGGIGTWTKAKRGIGDNTFSLIGAPYPVLKKGDTPQFGQYDWAYVLGNDHAITTSCKNVELAARLLDYGYSEAGNRLYNYGIEGVTYNMVDGKIVFTDYVTKNPEGKSASNVLLRYVMSTYNGPLVQSEEVVNVTRTYEEQNDAIRTWSQTNMKAHKLPYLDLTAQEAEEVASINTDIATFKDEMFYGFIYGTESLDDYDVFVKRIKELGAERAIEIYQNAIERLK